MKLDRNTKNALHPGMILRFNDGSEYTVMDIYPVNRGGLNITVKCRDGRYIYCTPSSGFYGAEMVDQYEIVYKPLNLHFAYIAADDADQALEMFDDAYRRGLLDFSGIDGDDRPALSDFEIRK